MAASTALALALPTAPLAMANPAAQQLVPQAVASVAQSTLSWVVAHKLQAAASILLGVPLLAALEAGYIVLKYRSQHGSAPGPITPSHGTVTVTVGDANVGVNADVSTEAVNDQTQFTSVPAHISGRTLDPLRLLVIGDSLAAGVGTSASCTPVLPESIATALSRDLGGRTVQWTALGEPGASAGWITRTLESLQDTDGMEEKDRYAQAIEAWIRKQLMEEDDNEATDPSPEPAPTVESEIGQYDVAVLLTGSNDLKFAVLPWMFRQQKREEGTVKDGDFAAELRNAIDAVSRKMKAGLSESIDRVLTSVEGGIDAVRSTVEEALPEAVLDRLLWSNMTDGAVLRGGGGNEAMPSEDRVNADADHDGESKVATTVASASAPQKSTGGDQQQHRPLVILPALPAKVLPVSRTVPLRWIAFPLLRVIENAKRKLSRLYPDSILFVEAPGRIDFEAYMQERGSIWNRRQLEAHIERATDVSPLECRQTLHLMQEYSDDDNRESPEPFLSTDGIHPNDFGYEFWGRLIASSIVEEWAASGCDACASNGDDADLHVNGKQKI